MYICHSCYKCTIFVRKKTNRITKHNSTHSKNESAIDVWRQDGETQHEARRGRSERVEYSKRITVARLVRGISGNIRRLERKGNEALHTLEGDEGQKSYE
jgi:ribosome-binding protein aMBF1 (putative translation factor)